METKEETDKLFSINQDIFNNRYCVSLYSALKGYASLRLGEDITNCLSIDLDPEKLRELAEHLNYCADYIDEITPKY